MRKSPSIQCLGFAAHGWASPADLLTEHLKAWLSDSHSFRAVVEPGSSAEYRYILEGQILELYGAYVNPEQPAAVIKAHFVLVYDLEGAGKIVFEKQYLQVEPLTSSDAMPLLQVGVPHQEGYSWSSQWISGVHSLLVTGEWRDTSFNGGAEQGHCSNLGCTPGTELRLKGSRIFLFRADGTVGTKTRRN